MIFTCFILIRIIVVAIFSFMYFSFFFAKLVSMEVEKLLGKKIRVLEICAITLKGNSGCLIRVPTGKEGENRV